MAIEGFLEFLSTTSVRGWAYDTDAPEEYLDIIVRIGAQFCGSGCANIKRYDLVVAGIGDGSHGFNVDISAAQISTTATSTIEVHAVRGPKTVQLPRTRVRTNCIADLISDHRTQISDDTQFPVFVLGPARSGTSAITLALLASMRYEGSGEGHLLPLVHLLLATVDTYYKRYSEDRSETMLTRVPREAFQKWVRRGFVQLTRDLFPTGYWLDKTPTLEMVRAAPLMRELWPNARFIFMKRRLVENMVSRRRKFPSDATQVHYSDWASVMRTWLGVRAMLNRSALEVEHRQLVLDPADTTNKIADFLQMSRAETDRLGRYVSENRPERTDPHFGATYSLDDLRLSELEARQLKATCDPLMAAYGYGYGSSYYTDEPAEASSIDSADEMKTFGKTHDGS